MEYLRAYLKRAGEQRGSLGAASEAGGKEDGACLRVTDGVPDIGVAAAGRTARRALRSRNLLILQRRRVESDVVDNVAAA